MYSGQMLNVRVHTNNNREQNYNGKNWNDAHSKTDTHISGPTNNASPLLVTSAEFDMLEIYRWQ